MNKLGNLKLTLIAGAAWSIGTRWAVRGIGFISTIVMARLLLPADYGVVAMAMLLVSLTQALLDFGASTALLRKGSITTEEVNSAWTLGLVQGALIGLLLLIASPFAAEYFKEPRVGPVLWTFAACIALAHFGNIGMVLAQKDFNFSIGFKHGVGVKLIGTTVTIAAGFLFGDYRALVAGVAAGYLSGMALSYVLHPYRPRWDTTHIAEIWALTKWLMLAGVGSFILRKGDELIAARVGTAKEFGLYNVAADLGQLPTGELGPAILRAFLPVLSTIQDDVERTNKAVIKTVSAVNTIILPVGAGFAAVAAPAVDLILGAAWVESVPLLAAFALAGAIQTIFSPVNTLLVLRGHTRIQSKIVWLEFCVFLVAALALVPQFFLLGLVGARIAGSLVNLIATAGIARQKCGISGRALAMSVARPLAGSIGMYFAIAALMSHMNGSIAQLAVSIFFGATTYTLWSALSWHAFGRPEGLESTVADHLILRYAKRSKR